MLTNSAGQAVRPARELVHRGSLDAALGALISSFSNLVGQARKQLGQRAAATGQSLPEGEASTDWGCGDFGGSSDPLLKQNDGVPSGNVPLLWSPLPAIGSVAPFLFANDPRSDEPACRLPLPVGDAEPIEPACRLPLPVQWGEPAPEDDSVNSFPPRLGDDSLIACRDYPLWHR